MTVWQTVVVILLVEMDGYFHQVLLTGKKCFYQQLKQKYFQAKKLAYHTKDLPIVFCRLHHFECVSYDCTVKIDFVIDTDTDRIYSPSY